MLEYPKDITFKKSLELSDIKWTFDIERTFLAITVQCIYVPKISMARPLCLLMTMLEIYLNFMVCAENAGETFQTKIPKCNTFFKHTPLVCYDIERPDPIIYSITAIE